MFVEDLNLKRKNVERERQSEKEILDILARVKHFPFHFQPDFEW